MATNAQWTVIFDDKKIIKQNGDGAGDYDIVDNDFWGQAKFSNIWAIQYGTAVASDTVEYRDETPHSSWEAANLGDFQDFIDRWDAAHLARLQFLWDNNNEDGESESDKIARLGARPTSYSS
tara:strand:- start:589 stop:954 length:366 start_codon:yes stop_codon:yes gene_type:complete